MRTYTRTPVVDRIMAKVEKTETGCWLWTGSVGSSGYGKVWMPGRSLGKDVSTHRTVYEHHRGAIPDGLVIDHLCGVLRCCNPDHLEPVTHAENQKRRAAKKDSCAHGHEYTETNTRVTERGRECRTCCALREAQRRARNPIAPCPGYLRHRFLGAPTCQRCGAARHALLAACRDLGMPDPLSSGVARG